jgi:probable HAF family extracellular repeat protein
MRDLGTLGGSASCAYGINTFGHVVGEATTPTGTFHAFLYRDGRMENLNRRLPPQSEWVLERANAINDRGQIVGAARIRGRLRAFLLSPASTPEGTSAKP